jgi:hypothetical protein
MRSPLTTHMGHFKKVSAIDGATVAQSDQPYLTAIGVLSMPDFVQTQRSLIGKGDTAHGRETLAKIKEIAAIQIDMDSPGTDFMTEFARFVLKRRAAVLFSTARLQYLNDRIVQFFDELHRVTASPEDIEKVRNRLIDAVNNNREYHKLVVEVIPKIIEWSDDPTWSGAHRTTT